MASKGTQFSRYQQREKVTLNMPFSSIFRKKAIITSTWMHEAPAPAAVGVESEYLG